MRREPNMRWPWDVPERALMVGIKRVEQFDEDLGWAMSQALAARMPFECELVAASR